MSSTPNHSASVPSHPTYNFEHRQTTYRNYTNYGYHASDRGVVTHINHLTNYQTPNPLLGKLERHCSHSAAFDSAARGDPPRCAESTRLRIIQIMEEWINSEGDDAAPSSLFWLHGGAGVGKSALAQSLSEKYQEKKQLGASFFFFRSDASRNKGDHLIPTLVSHLVCGNFKGATPFVEDKIRENPGLFTKKYQTQIRELLIEPLQLALKSKGALISLPQLIVIDGLDECQNPDVQCELLQVIARSIPQIPYRLRFLVTSRPEAHIARVFSHDRALQAINVREYNLSKDRDADMDIRKFIEDEFAEIRRVHSLRRHLHHDWPDKKAITSLVERSSGHFIFASTVISYIRSPKHRPDDRLEVILHLRPPQDGDRPYAQLDALYALIFDGIGSQLEKTCLVLGILYLQSQRIGFFVIPEFRLYTKIEEFLEMKAGDLVLLLDPILSLVSIDSDKVCILHKSLFDYLLDFTRGGHLPFDLARVHESAATYILTQKIVQKACNMETFLQFAYHCQYAYLNDTLKEYLRSLEVPYPKSVLTVAKPLPSWPAFRDEFLRSIIWHFFRTMSSEEFDSTGQVCDQYMAKWTDYLQEHSGLPRPSIQRHSRVPIAKVEDKKSWLKRKLDKLTKSKLPKVEAVSTVQEPMDPLKSKLDTLSGLLTEWKPQNLNPMGVGIDPAKRTEMIKKEQSVFTAYAKSSLSGNTKAISSLVPGGDFIHSFNLELRDNEVQYVTLRTYSTHRDMCYQEAHVGHLDVIRETQAYLTRVEKYIFSDLYQKYGLNR